MSKAPSTAPAFADFNVHATCARRSPRPPGRICKAQPLLEPGPSSSFASIGGEAAFDNLVDLLPSSSPLDAPEAVDANQPTLIHNAAARGWSWSGLLKSCVATVSTRRR